MSDRDGGRRAADGGPGTGSADPVVLTGKEARQGTTVFPVKNVLVGSLVLVVIAFVVAYLVI